MRRGVEGSVDLQRQPEHGLGVRADGEEVGPLGLEVNDETEQAVAVKVDPVGTVVAGDVRDFRPGNSGVEGEALVETAHKEITRSELKVYAVCTAKAERCHQLPGASAEGHDSHCEHRQVDQVSEINGGGRIRLNNRNDCQHHRCSRHHHDLRHHHTSGVNGGDGHIQQARRSGDHHTPSGKGLRVVNRTRLGIGNRKRRGGGIGGVGWDISGPGQRVRRGVIATRRGTVAPR